MSFPLCPRCGRFVGVLGRLMPRALHDCDKPVLSEKLTVADEADQLDTALDALAAANLRIDRLERSLSKIAGSIGSIQRTISQHGIVPIKGQ